MANGILSYCSVCGAVFVASNKNAKTCSHKCGYEIKRRNMAAAFSENFWSNVSVLGNNDCWEWKRSKNANGYGTLTRQSKHLLAHRVAYEIHNQTEVPKGMLVRHKCDNRCCCNPAHLEIGTQTDNMRDMSARGRGAFQVLSKDDALNIRKMYFDDGVFQVEIAKKYGVCKGTISSIVRGENWTYLGSPSKEKLSNARRRPRPNVDHSLKDNVKLNYDIVRRIRSDFALGEKQSSLVVKYGLSQMTISRVVRRQSWKYDK